MADSRRGFTVLFAVLVSTIVLAIGASIANKAMRQSIFTTSARDSHKAFYSANSALECALYWDNRGSNVFPTSTSASFLGSSVTCNGETILLPAGGGGLTTFTETEAVTRLAFTRSNNCPTLTITKKISPRTTQIEARGYNTCTSSDPRRVERGLRASY